MTTVKVPLFGQVYRNVDGVEVKDQSSILVNGIIDELGFIVRRPGLSTFVDLGRGSSPVSGLWWWPQKNCVIATSGGYLIKVTYTTGTVTAANITTNTLGSEQTPSFTIGNNSNVSTPTFYGLATAGGAIVESNGTGTTTTNFATLGGSSPTTATHLGYVDGYVVANDGSNRFFWCDLNTPTTWNAANYASGAGNPDFVVGLKTFGRQIFLFGSLTTEIWENDGVSPFSRIGGGFIEVGCSAPYSIVISSDAIFWLDHTRHFVQYRDGAITRISTPYDKDLSNYSQVSDCVGHRIDIDGKPVLIFTFHAQDKSLIYNLVTGGWSEWRHWDTENGAFARYLGQSYCYVPTWGKHLVGGRNSSIVYEMSPSTHLDGTAPIRLLHETGNIDYGTSARKRSTQLRLRLKPSGSDGNLIFQWNDDGRGWSNEVWIPLEQTGSVVTLYPRGVFRNRQYRFVCTDEVTALYGDAEEDIEVLR